MAATAPLLAGPTLALSGGGFRSTLFHTGTIIRLNELKLLSKLKCISSVSGGSIANGYLGYKWSRLGFDGTGFATQLSAEFVQPLIAFCSKSIDIPSVVSGLLDPFKHIGQELIESLDDLLFKSATLQALPDPTSAPRFVFNATSMQTGVRFWFSRADAGDYRIGVTENPDIPLAVSVAASSAFPPFFAPMPVDLKGKKFIPALAVGTTKPISDLVGKPEYHQTALLADGGTYDNMALEELWTRYNNVLVSDAGSPFDSSPTVSTDWLHEMLRIIDLMMRADEAERRRELINKFHAAGSSAGGVSGAYWGIATAIAHYGTAGALTCLPKNTKPLQKIATRLAAFTPAQQESLVNWGYALCDAAVRWGGEITGIAAMWPFPNNALDKA
jgi:NTE family protein